MMRSFFAVLTVGVVGFAVSSLAFSLVLPLVVLAIKLVFFVGIVYLILRLVNPSLADRLREKCCGSS